jgi:hypothetical protein
VVAPRNGEGKVLPSLEAWVQEHADLPAPLVASAKALAAQVDRQPAASPLWGRLSTILVELISPTLRQQSFSRELRSAIEYVALARADEEWRFQKYQEAVDHGDPYAAEGWLKVVPISCVHGRHRWKRPNYWGEAFCEYCDTTRAP